MKLIPCPLNGPRPADEFLCAGEVRTAPDAARCSDAQWAQYVFHRAGSPGIRREWWCHLPSGNWFILERDTATDAILGTFTAGSTAVPR